MHLQVLTILVVSLSYTKKIVCAHHWSLVGDC